MKKSPLQLKKRHLALHCFFLFLLSLSPLIQASDTGCSFSPDTNQMNQQFFDWLKAATLKQKTRVIIFPFQDGTSITPDETLEKAFSILFYDLLTQSGSQAVYHPYLSLELIQNKGILSADYFNEEKMLPLAKEFGATHLVLGLFQKMPKNQLRFFIKVGSVDQTGLGSPQEFLSEQSNRFFSVALDAARSIAKKTGKSQLNSSTLKGYLKNYPDFEAFRFYTKGVEKASQYNSIQLETAKAWFEKAFTFSYNFPEALSEKVRVLTMLALLYQQEGKDPSLPLHEAMAVINQMGTHLLDGKYAPGSALSPKRWLSERTLAINGVSAFKSQRYNEAAALLKKAIDLVPEDGWARYYLNQTHQRMGAPKAGKNNENPVNGCL